jgi:hypothetical protein
MDEAPTPAKVFYGVLYVGFLVGGLVAVTAMLPWAYYTRSRSDV